jgi:hypothetical protein
MAKHAYIPRDCPRKAHTLLHTQGLSPESSGKAQRLNPLGNRLNLLLEFLDLRFVTGDEGLDKVTSWLGFR